ncbi:MAG TPA: hypothetical protein VI168_01515 [Croceibacterium sp.]
MRRTPLLAAALVLALAGCTEDSPEKEDGVSADAALRPPPDPTLAKSAIRPALTPEDIEGAGLAGELTCAFAQHGAEGPLLMASANVLDVARADGVLKLGPATLRLRGAATGGFNAMVQGARFTSGELEARVVVTSETPREGGESPPRPSRLEIASPAGAQKIEGAWTCGP